MEEKKVNIDKFSQNCWGFRTLSVVRILYNYFVCYTPSSEPYRIYIDKCFS
jgi:hypothetical protein